MSPTTPEPLPIEEVQRRLRAELPDWTLHVHRDEHEGILRSELYRELHFPSFLAAIDFQASFAPVCEERAHHPRWENTWRRVRIWLCTHDAGDQVSERDLDLAARIDAHAQPRVAPPGQGAD